MTALWYITQALGVLLNVAVVQIPMALVYQFFFYFVLMLLVTAIFLAINCRTCCLNSISSASRSRSGSRGRESATDHEKVADEFEDRAIPGGRLLVS